MRVRSSDQEDYILRMIREAAEAVRRLRELLSGEVTREAGERAVQETRTATRALLGTQAGLLTQLDATTAVQLIGNPVLVRVWADLIQVEADYRERLGETMGAHDLRQRARALLEAQGQSELAS